MKNKVLSMVSDNMAVKYGMNKAHITRVFFIVSIENKKEYSDEVIHTRECFELQLKPKKIK